MSAAVALGLSGCAAVSFPHVDTIGDMQDKPYVVLVVVDALGPDLLAHLAEGGHIPNIRRHVLDRGMTGENVISTYPSVTAAAITSMLTGVLPGRHQIPNFTWVNRANGEYRSYIGTDIGLFEADLAKHAKTIFQYLPRDESASFGFIQGAAAGTDDSLIFTTLNPFRELAPLMHLTITDLFKKVGLGEGIPHLMAYYEWRVDVRGHRKGRLAPETIEVMRKADAQFGRVVQAYKDRGLYDKTYFVFASDHGLGTVKEHFYIDQAFHNIGFKRKLISYNLGETYFPKSWARADSIWFSQEPVYPYNAIIGSAGGGCAAIDLVHAGGLGPNGKPDPDLWKGQLVYEDLLRYDIGWGPMVYNRHVDVVDFLLSMEPVDFLIVREVPPKPGGDSRSLVISREGIGRITRRTHPVHGLMYSYELADGADPLGYFGAPGVDALVGEEFYDGYAWLEATAAHAYPDAPVLISSVLDTPRSGTVLVTMKPGWSVNSKVMEKHAGYGRDEMAAVMAVSGPGITQGTFHAARIVDITPTILALLGDKERPGQFDGRPVPEIMEQIRWWRERAGSTGSGQAKP